MDLVQRKQLGRLLKLNDDGTTRKHITNLRDLIKLNLSVEDFVRQLESPEGFSTKRKAAKPSAKAGAGAGAGTGTKTGDAEFLGAGSYARIESIPTKFCVLFDDEITSKANIEENISKLGFYDVLQHLIICEEDFSQSVIINKSKIKANLELFFIKKFGNEFHISYINPTGNSQSEKVDQKIIDIKRKLEEIQEGKKKIIASLKEELLKNKEALSTVMLSRKLSKTEGDAKKKQLREIGLKIEELEGKEKLLENEVKFYARYSKFDFRSEAIPKEWFDYASLQAFVKIIQNETSFILEPIHSALKGVGLTGYEVRQSNDRIFTEFKQIDVQEPVVASSKGPDVELILAPQRPIGPQYLRPIKPKEEIVSLQSLKESDSSEARRAKGDRFYQRGRELNPTLQRKVIKFGIGYGGVLQIYLIFNNERSATDREFADRIELLKRTVKEEGYGGIIIIQEESKLTLVTVSLAEIARNKFLKQILELTYGKIFNNLTINGIPLSQIFEGNNGYIIKNLEELSKALSLASKSLNGVLSFVGESRSIFGCSMEIFKNKLNLFLKAQKALLDREQQDQDYLKAIGSSGRIKFAKSTEFNGPLHTSLWLICLNMDNLYAEGYESIFIPIPVDPSLQGQINSYLTADIPVDSLFKEQIKSYLTAIKNNEPVDPSLQDQINSYLTDIEKHIPESLMKLLISVERGVGVVRKVEESFLVGIIKQAKLYKMKVCGSETRVLEDSRSDLSDPEIVNAMREVKEEVKKIVGIDNSKSLILNPFIRGYDESKLSDFEKPFEVQGLSYEALNFIHYNMADLVYKGYSVIFIPIPIDSVWQDQINKYLSGSKDYMPESLIQYLMSVEKGIRVVMEDEESLLVDIVKQAKRYGMNVYGSETRLSNELRLMDSPLSKPASIIAMEEVMRELLSTRLIGKASKFIILKPFTQDPYEIQNAHYLFRKFGIQVQVLRVFPTLFESTNFHDGESFIHCYEETPGRPNITRGNILFIKVGDTSLDLTIFNKPRNSSYSYSKGITNVGLFFDKHKKFLFFANIIPFLFPATSIPKAEDNFIGFLIDNGVIENKIEVVKPLRADLARFRKHIYNAIEESHKVDTFMPHLNTNDLKEVFNFFFSQPLGYIEVFLEISRMHKYKLEYCLSDIACRLSKDPAFIALSEAFNQLCDTKKLEEIFSHNSVYSQDKIEQEVVLDGILEVFPGVFPGFQKPKPALAGDEGAVDRFEDFTAVEFVLEDDSVKIFDSSKSAPEAGAGSGAGAGSSAGSNPRVQPSSTVAKPTTTARGMGAGSNRK